MALRIPLAHIEGGEVSEGAIDDAVRNALTKLSHIHFTSTHVARSRVIAMGEEEWRVHRVGAPSLDHLRRSMLKSREEVETELASGSESADHPDRLSPYHHRSRHHPRGRCFVFALATLPEQLVFCYPNADAGSRELMERAHAFVQERGNARIFVNLNPVCYWSLLRCVDLLLGNSSSGIMEAASFALPAVNIGIRQRGRERALNVLDAEATQASILEQICVARSREFRCSLAGMENPYGDGHAAERIAEVIASVPLNEELLIKKSQK